MFPDTPTVSISQPMTTIRTELFPVGDETKADPEPKPQKKTRDYHAWYEHVNKFKSEHSGMSHQEAVKAARGSYTKAPKKKRDSSNYKPNAWMQHVANWTKNNPEWRKKYTYKDVLKLCKDTYKKSQ